MKGVDVIGTFNNESKAPIDEIKKRAAELIDLIQVTGLNGRHNAIATTHIETATMFALKSIFTPDGK